MNRLRRDPRLTVAAGACDLAGARRFATAIRDGMGLREVLVGMHVLVEVAPACRSGLLSRAIERLEQMRDELAIHDAIGTEAPFASPERDQRESLP